MFIVLPLIVLVELAFLFRSKTPQPQRSFRESFLSAAILICACAVILTEGLSLFSQVNVWFVRGAWAFAAIVLTAVSLRKRVFAVCRIEKICLSWQEWFILVSTAVVILLSAVIAFQCPPNTADSLVYHLPRIMFWAQNGSLSFYPTPVLRQLNYPPGAEMLLLQSYLLAGDDRWFNFIQWFAMVGSLTGVSVLAKYLGAERRGQLFASLAAATVPMGVLQSNSTQTDYLLTFWVMCTAVFVWRAAFIDAKASAGWIGLSAGLAFLTKGTAFIILPFILILLWSGLKKGFIDVLKALGMVVGLLIILNAGYWARNVLGQPNHTIFPYKEASLVVDKLWPQGMAAGIVRHSALNFMTPFEVQVKGLHDLVFFIENKLNIAHDDPRIFSYDPASAFRGNYVFNEDVAANSAHFILSATVILLALFFWSKKEKNYAACVLAATLLLACIVKWQPWAARFHLPLFVMAAPLIGIGLSRIRLWGLTAGAVLVIFAAGLLLTHPLRPVIGNPNIFTFKDRRMWYFAHIQDTTGFYGQAVSLIRSSGCKDIGVITAEGSYLYPLWPLLSDRSVRFEYVNVNNFSSHFLNVAQQQPCLMLTLDDQQPQVVLIGTQVFREVWKNKIFQVYSRM